MRDDVVLSEDGFLFHAKKGKPVELPMPLAPLADTHGHLTSLRRLDAGVAIARAALAGVRLLVVPVDPSDDVPDVPAFLSWFEEGVERAGDLLEGIPSSLVAPGLSWESTSCASADSHEMSALRGEARPQDRDSVDVAPLVDNVHFVAGVHPYGSRLLVEDGAVRERLLALLEDGRCVGVGEFGLDYGPWNELPASVQEEAFRLQLRLAHERNLPVELHIRDATDDAAAQAHADALRILREEGVPEAGCDLHCFTSGPEVMRPFVELGCHVAFGGAATFGRSDDIREAAAACPAHLLLTETDSPYMAPVPLRGQECEPAMVAFTAARLAQVRADAGGVPVAQTYETLWHNANAFFGLGKR